MSQAEAAREEMVAWQIIGRGIVDPTIVAAMRKVPREMFVHENLRSAAYKDEALPIGDRQMISQPFIAAFMTEALALKPSDRVLEIGTGTGYHTALLAEMVAQVFTVEIYPDLAESARATLSGLGYRNIDFLVGDGASGWPDRGPFDAILVTAAPSLVPDALMRQLAEGGRLIAPVGVRDQTVKLFKNKDGQLSVSDLLCVRFVTPLVASKEAL